MSEDPTVLGELRDTLTRYVAFPSDEAADAVTLWIAATHAQQAWEHATRLAVISPEKRCGKSRLLDVIEATCHSPLMTVNISAAALVRSIGDDPPVVLLDEADTIFGRSLKGDEKAEHLRGILNAGYQRNRPYIRYDAAHRRNEPCPTFAMAALAAIGDLPDTVMDRAVVVRMRRRAPGETVMPYRLRRDAPPLRELGKRLAGWAGSYAAEFAGAEPDTGVDDRAHDCWEPLAAVAAMAGWDWPARALRAAKTLTGETETAAESDSMRLLADLAAVFGDAQAMPTSAVLHALHDIEESPWRDVYGKPLDARGLAERLRPFGVRSRTVRAGESTLRGYRREDLWDSWARYVPQVIRNMRHVRNAAGRDVADVADVAPYLLADEEMP